LAIQVMKKLVNFVAL